MSASSINLYKFVGDKKQVDKDTNHGSTLIETITGDFKQESIDLLNPTIELEPTATSTVAKILKECNYCYVSDFGRYYFIDNMSCKSGTRIELQLSIDPLMSWETEILAMTEGIVERNAKTDGSNLFLDDSELHIYNNPNIQTYKFDYAAGNTYEFGNQNFVLAVAGG